MLTIRIGEGAGIILAFFFWLLFGLVLAIHVSYAVGFFYVLISFVISVALEPGIREIREAILFKGDTRVIEEKRFSAGWVSFVVLRGPVRITARRIALLLGVIAGGFAVLISLMAFGDPDGLATSLTAISAGIFLLLIVINFLEVRWREADALESNHSKTPN